MTKEKSKETEKSNRNVEFGSELGDFNASKFYEIEHTTKRSSQKDNDNNPQCGGLN